MAWSVSLNPGKYQPPAEASVKVKVVPAWFDPRRGTLEKAAQSLELNYFKVNLDGFAIPNCIIFRPAGVKVAAGASYWVEIRGLKSCHWALQNQPAGGASKPASWVHAW